MSDYTEATEGCQPAAPDPGAEVGLPRQAGHEMAKNIQHAKGQAGHSLPRGFGPFLNTASPDQVTADGGRGVLNPKRASLKTLQPENF